jgi:hypothetical protein
LHPYFKKEEEYALPPLGLLSSLVSEEHEHEQMGRGRGEEEDSRITQDIKNNVIVMTDKLNSSFSYD